VDISSSGNEILVRVDPDEDVVDTVRRAVDRLGLAAAVVTFGAGTLRATQLGVPATLGRPAARTAFPEELDLCALSGSVLRRGGALVARLYAVLNDARHQVLGGLLLQARCRGSVEVLLSPTKLHEGLLAAGPNVGGR
jgi:predicted DNA-binding protein with PD1-like motif